MREHEDWLQSALVGVAEHVLDFFRLLVWLAVVLLAFGALRAWDGDDINRALDYVVGSAPVRAGGQLIAGLRSIIGAGVDAGERQIRNTPPGPTADITPRFAQPAGTGGESPASTTPGSAGLPFNRRGSSAMGETADVASGVNGTTGAAGTSKKVLWTVSKGRETIRAELLDRGMSAELLLIRNGRVWQRELHHDGEMLRSLADNKRAELESLGWKRSAR